MKRVIIEKNTKKERSINNIIIFLIIEVFTFLRVEKGKRGSSRKRESQSQSERDGFD